MTAASPSWLIAAGRRLLDRQANAFWLATVLGGLAALRAFTATLNHDTSWYLASTARWLEGAVLYRDVIEVNPPLAFFMTAPPVWLAGALDLFAVPVFVSYLLILIALSLALADSVLRTTNGTEPPFRRGLLLTGVIVLALLPARDFGQREHLLLIFAWPYVLLVGRRAVGLPIGASLAVLVGAFAVFGVGLKPHFLLLPAVLEIALLRGRQGLIRDRFRPETWALGGGIALYVALVPLVTPDYLGAIVPMALLVYEQAYSAPFLAVLFQAKALLLAFGLLLAARWPLTRRDGWGGLVDVFLLAGGALLITFLLQSKGWSYQLYPALAFAGATAATMALIALSLDPSAIHRGETEGRPAWRLSPLTLIAIFVVLLGDTYWHRGWFHYRVMQEAGPLVADHAADGSIYVFSSNVSATYPLVVYAGVRSASRYPAQWLLPGLEQRRRLSKAPPTAAEAARLGEIDRYIADSVVEDLMRDPPDLVLVDIRAQKSYFGGLAFDYIAYFNRDPRFAAIWRDYQPLTDITGYRVYRRGHRSSAAAPGPA